MMNALHVHGHPLTVRRCLSENGRIEGLPAARKTHGGKPILAGQAITCEQTLQCS